MPYPQLIAPKARYPRQYIVRFLRATWHDSRALFREFRRSLIAIFLSIFVGGWLYNTLAIRAGYPPIGVYDIPYVMLALMVLENPLEYVPVEWHLILFWYLLPAIGVYIIGQGAVDFVRLFFNRTERRSAWELAVAQTYRQHIVLIGVGHVGLRVARTLIQMGFEVVAVDENVNPDADEELRQMGIPLVTGDGRLTTVVQDAGIQHARAVIVCTSNDHINLEITMRARDLAPDARIVTRMWDARFAEQLKRFLDVEVMSASDLAAPAFAGSALNIEITQTLHVGGLDYSMIKLTVKSGSFMEGKTIDALQEDEHVDIVLHGSGGREPVVHPSGEIVVQSGDTLVLFARHSKITEIVSRNYPQKVKS